MKKHSLLKAISISFLIVVVLSWIIPTGSYSSSTFTSAGTTPVGIINLFRLPVMTIQTFIQYTIVLLAIGGFYGVLNKTGVYDNIVRGIAKKWKGKEKIALIVIMVLFALVSSLTGLSMLLFALVPFIAAILLVLGYDKLTVLLSTIGSTLVGGAASTFGFAGAGYIKNVFSINMTDEVITKIILFVLLIGLFIFFVTKKAKLNSITGKKNTIENKIPFLYSDKENDRKALPLIITCIILFVLCLVGMYNWYYAFGIETFNNFHTALTNIKIGDYPIVSNLITGVSSLGYWGNYELAITLLIASVIIGWIYNESLEEFFEGYKKGVIDMFPVALIATIANIVFAVMLSNDGTIYATITNWLGGFSDGFSLPITGLVSLAGSLCYNDFYYVLTEAYNVLGTYDAVYYPIIGVMTTAIFGLAMMILPTSVMLVAGLKYFDISYKEWIKSIWKYLLEALVVVILVSIIVVVLV